MTTLTADFSQKISRNNLSGFLQGNLTNNYPADNILKPLKPAWWRTAPEGSPFTRMARIKALGANPIIVLSDGYGYPPWSPNPAPYNDNNATLISYVTATATAYKNAGYTGLYWNIWNEPDSYPVNPFWDGTIAQAQSAFLAAYNAILAVDSTAKIGGPCISNFYPTIIESWLTFFWQNGITLAYMDWHELSLADANIPSISTNVATMKQWEVGYPGIKNTPVIITESVGPSSHLSPGDILCYLETMGAAGVYGAIKACWTAADTTNFCFNNRLDGLLAADFTPAASWWAYKTYADGISYRVQAASDNANVVALASSQTDFAANTIQVLVGYGGQGFTSPISATVNLTNLGSAGVPDGTRTLKVYKVPDSGETVVGALTSISTGTVSVSGGAATVSISSMALHEEYVIYIS